MASLEGNLEDAPEQDRSEAEATETLSQTANQLGDFAALLADLLNEDREGLAAIAAAQDEQSQRSASLTSASNSEIALPQLQANAEPSLEESSASAEWVEPEVQSATSSTVDPIEASNPDRERTPTPDETSDETEVVRLRQLNASLSEKVTQLEEQLGQLNLLVSQSPANPPDAPIHPFEPQSTQPNSLQTLLEPEAGHSPDNTVQSITHNNRDKPKRSTLFFAVAGLVLLLFLLPWGISQYRERRLERQIALSLASASELAVYRLEADIRGKTLLLSGKLPNRYLRQKVEQIARSVAPALKLENDIIVVEVPPDPIQVAHEVQQVVAALNQIEGMSISAHFEAGTVTVEGTAPHIAEGQKIVEALKKIPGVQSATNRLQVRPFQIATRIYFDTRSTTLKTVDIGAKVFPIKQLLQRYPMLELKIVGYSDPKETASGGNALALKRAQEVQTMLEDGGIDRRRLQVLGRSGYPPGVSANQPKWLSRCVLFEIVESD